ncbi:aldose 1-epimerase [Fistulifera solaris]|uniref:Aldose 1-epimerase n=1 Tax=Fistulifera solaris TaxID=1519565 RepID=A0A1Z5KND5_FISSO|nr:aldose 1-epimerase [Fistulifera solaris]|eukprot:GAX27521.1 aldose 1-epimerase [Fistulifera solaris]
MSRKVILTNSRGVQVNILSLGATIQSWTYNGFDIVLGYDTEKEYREGDLYFGAVVGRVANRIAHGKFRLNDQDYQLACNNGSHHLHGGPKGFHRVMWEIEEADELSVRFSYESQDGEEGYPAHLIVYVKYSLHPQLNELSVEYEARVLDNEKSTHINLSQHSYFNLSSDPTVENHVITIHADSFTPTDATSIPTGKIRSVQGTAMDFRSPRLIREALEQSHNDDQIQWAGGFDHNFCCNKAPNVFALVAKVACGPRTLEVWTTEPGVQFYTGNYLQGKGKGGRKYEKRAGLCLETQHFPDSPNQPDFPSTRLNPGETFYSKSMYRWLENSA